MNVYAIRRVLALLALAMITAATVFAMAPAADATQQDYVTVAWKVPLTSTEWNEAGQPTGNALDGIIWPQEFELEAVTQGANVNALDDTLTDCGVYQIDVYPNGEAAQALIASGTLDWGDDHGLVQTWKFIDNGDCPPPQPPADPRTEEESTTDCTTGLVTTVTRSYETPYVLVDNVWVPGDEVLIGEASSQREATDEECPPPPREYECDGTGDGVNDHDYNDPTDGICAEEVPPTTAPPVDPPAAVPTPEPAETLPVTGRGLDLAIFGATVTVIGFAMRFLSKRGLA